MIVLSSVCRLCACVHSDARDLGSTQGAFQVALSRLHLGTPGVLQRILENDESNDNINGFGAGNEIGRRPFRFYIQLSLRLCQACHDIYIYILSFHPTNDAVFFCSDRRERRRELEARRQEVRFHRARKRTKAPPQAQSFVSNTAALCACSCCALCL